MGLLPDNEYFVVKKGGLSQFQTFVAYLGGSFFQTVGDNPVTAYRQLIQQYDAPKLKSPYNLEARRLAGFDDEELNYLAAHGL